MKRMKRTQGTGGLQKSGQVNGARNRKALGVFKLEFVKIFHL